MIAQIKVGIAILAVVGAVAPSTMLRSYNTIIRY